MATTILTSYALAARFPNPILDNRTYDLDDDFTAQVNAELKDLHQRSMTRVRGDTDTALLTADGSTASVIDQYYMDYSAGSVLIAGLPGIIAAGTDVGLIGAVDWGKSYKLDGTAAVILTADGKTYDMAVVAIVVNGAVQLHAVFGAEAADAAEVAPTMTQISAALIAAGITNIETRAGLVVARMKFQRVAVDTITVTNIVPAANLGLMAERSSGGLFGVQA
jgi:hypothetical protein